MSKDMITRTVKGTLLTILCANTETGECCHEEVVFKGNVLDDEKAMKKLRKMFANSTIVPVQIVKKDEVFTRYGMPEEEFLKYAVEIPLLKRDTIEE